MATSRGYPDPLARLIEEFRRHPGVGPRSAERLAFHTLARPRDEAERLARALLECHDRVRPCVRCFALVEEGRGAPAPSEGDCRTCLEARRDDRRLCVVESPRDVFAFLSGAVWDGQFHVLGGLISPLDGVGPEDLHVAELLARVARRPPEEVVLALNPSTEGESTSLYLQGLLEEQGLKVTRIAYGLPVGGELEYTDPVTLARALEGRK